MEGLEDWDEENEHAIESMEISDKLDTLRNDVAGLTTHFKEDEDNEEIFNEVYNELAEKYEKAATEAQATFDLVKKYEAGDSGQQVEREEVRRHSKTSDRARLSTYKASGIGSGNRYRATNVRFGNRYRYKDGNVRSGNRYKAGNMRLGNRCRYRTGNMRSGSRSRAGSRNRACNRNRTASMKIIGVVEHEMLIEKDAGKRGKEF